MPRFTSIDFIRRLKKVVTFVFSHVGLCALVIGYSFAGGFLFRWLEQKTDMEPYNSTEFREQCIDAMLLISERYGIQTDANFSSWRSKITELLEIHDANVSSASVDGRYDKTLADLEERWSIINALFFCVTVITTIGYGHISPRTSNGRIVTIIYSIFGIPLMLLCLNNIGDSLAKTFRFTYRRVFCSCKEKENKDNYLLHSILQKRKSMELEAFKPYRYNKPNRRTMLISPPISATLHRGSDLPQNMNSCPQICSKSSSSEESKPSFRSHFPVHIMDSHQELAMNNIVSECASYDKTKVPDLPLKDYTMTNSKKREGANMENVSEFPRSLTPLLNVQPIWMVKECNGKVLSANKCLEDTSLSTSPIASSPLSTRADQTTTFSFNNTVQDWDVPDSRISITWEPSICNKDTISSTDSKKNLVAGKTLVVYNTLTGDALKQQSRIQRKFALMHKAKHGDLRNESTTVFTDPITGQAVNGDVLGLNYRPIEPETTDKDTRVPMTLVLSFVTGYLAIGAILFSSLERWSFMDALYFSFTTLSTIGFGDLVPGNLGFETREAQLKLIALALYVLLGMAVIAMSFSLVQEEVILKCKTFAQIIGLKEEN